MKSCCNRYLIAFLIVFFTTILNAQQASIIPYNLPEAQVALVNGDFTALNEIILSNLEHRHIWLVTDTHVYDFPNGTWNHYEEHQHNYSGYFPHLQDEELVQRRANNTWNNYQRYLSAYNNNETISSYIIQNWETNSWQNYYRTLYQYNNLSYGTFSTINGYLWQNNNWQNFSQTTYYYLANNLTDYAITQSWQNNAWVNSSKTEYVYDSYYRVAQMVFSYWNNNTWQLSARMVYSYNENSEYTSILTQLWNASAYQNSSRASYYYVNYGLIDMIYYENWTNNTWQNNMRMLYSYDSSSNRTESIRQMYSTTWLNDERRTMDYTFIIIANEDESLLPGALLINASPNPVRSQINLSIKSAATGKGAIRLFDSKGRMRRCMDFTVTSGIERNFVLKTDDLPSGIYIIRTNVNEQQMTNKVMVLK